MKNFGRIGWVLVMMFVVVLAFTSCGNAKKSKVESGRPALDSTGIVVQESEVIVEIDSITPDSTAQPVKK